VQAKTGARQAIPIHPQLRAALDAMPARNMTFLVTQTGAPFASGKVFYNWFTGRARADGVSAGLGPHGLRKAATRRLAEAGCTPHQIQAITGHRTLAEVERYTRAASQEELAKVAVSRIGPKLNGS
jgi:integrase